MQSTSGAEAQPTPSSTNSLRSLKGSMTLPLQSSMNASNGTVTHMRGLTPLSQLNSPDLKNLGAGGGGGGSGVTPFLTSPDFDKLISQSLSVGMTPTSGSSNAPQTPTTFLNPKYVTEEQERFVMNFDEKIKSMIKKEQEGGSDENRAGTVMMDISSSFAGQQQQDEQHEQQHEQHSAAASASNLSSAFAASQQQQQLQQSSAASIGNADCSSSCQEDDLMESCADRSQLDVNDQESLKLERKRQRNRDAARKCRERKLERIKFLEERVNELKSQNGKLQRTAVDLREQVRTLQQLIVEHTKRGCSLKESLAAKVALV